MNDLAIFYGSTSGATQEVCELIANNLSADIYDVKCANTEDFKRYNKFIFASSTYGDGALQDDWAEKINLLDEIDFHGKTVALVSIGNQERHAENFCSSIVDFLPKIKGANLVGQSELDGYKFEKSSAFINDKFIGLCVDFKGDSKWKSRVLKWCEKVKKEF
ncbi:flavodoxin domain-containing protein [Campylobacter geochelonis]|uniref:Flavodoxin n=1 Tax=Campylobacter geochelonis TaxID=1780362 RepID=A0A128EGG0_9BACT|nr:flavodoxin domain-containing protein [Campylobacter geochelonis]QKF71340.1 flavodoxin [Campylobacter geochelonis]CZE48009.1 flavodoxin [Campylobacter geochelonis]CZE48237.1 flavodoxin [Campylobacter geochelonis]CZE51043.1 flavodoxin [Campylobacter geochelonis]